MQITKKKFLSYVRIQGTGVINMLDIDRGTKLNE